jgi:hypothetical protein
MECLPASSIRKLQQAANGSSVCPDGHALGPRLGGECIQCGNGAVQVRRRPHSPFGRHQLANLANPGSSVVHGRCPQRLLCSAACLLYLCIAPSEVPHHRCLTTCL